MAPRQKETDFKLSRVTGTVLICLSIILGHLQPAECMTNHQCGFPQPLIDGDRFRVGDEFFSASSQYSGYPPQYARHLSNLKKCWCSKYLQKNSLDELQDLGREGQWLEVQFGATVIITGLKVTGYAYNDYRHTWDYVKKFNIYYGDANDEPEELQPITERQNGESVTKNFEVNHPFEYDLPLDGQIVAQKLRIVPLEWNNHYACMSLEATGCLVEGPSCVVTQLLSTDRSLLPLRQGHITEKQATTVDGFDLKDLVDNTGDDSYHFEYFPWCFRTDFNNHPYVDLKFNKPIWVTHMETRRHPLTAISDSRGYITDISLEYANQDDSFETYSDLFGEHTHAYNGEQFKTFWRPLGGSEIRFHMNEGTAASVDDNSPTYCWNIVLYGCTVEQETAETSQILGDSSPSAVAMQVGILIASVVGLVTFSALVIAVVVGVIKWTKRSRQDVDKGNEPTTSSEQSRGRSVTNLSTDTVVESLAYTWTRNESINASTLSASTSIQSENKLLTSGLLEEPLLKPITEEP